MITGVPYDAEIEYLESTRTQWIDTGVAGNEIRADGAIEGEVMFTAKTGGWAPAAAIGSDHNLNFYGLDNSNIRIYSRFNDFFMAFYASAFGIDTFVGIKVKTTARGGYWKVKINGTELQYNSKYTYLCADNTDRLLLFWSNGGTFRAPARIYWFKVFKGNNLVRDFIPVRIGNEGAMYDRVTRKVFRNAGTGSFVLGPDVARPILGLHRQKPLIYTAQDYVQDGLIAMWDGIENAGWGVHDPNATVWKDLVGNVDLTLHGGCSWTDKSLTFNGSTGYADADTSQGAWANVATLDCCLHFADQPSQCFVVCPSFEDGNLAIMLNGYRLCGFVNPTYRRVPDATVVPALNHVARTKVSGGSSPWFIDGQSVTCDNGNYWNANGSARTVFGASYDGQSGFFKGTIRRVCAYSRALTSEEIAANYAIDKSRFNIGGAS